MISNSTKQKRENIYVDVANGFFTQDTASQNFLIPNAIYMADQYNF